MDPGSSLYGLLVSGLCMLGILRQVVLTDATHYSKEPS